MSPLWAVLWVVVGLVWGVVALDGERGVKVVPNGE